MMPPTIYSYIKQEEALFEGDEIQLGSNWSWNFRNHVDLIFHLKNGVFYTGENNYLRAFKNIMEPMLNLAYWTEDIEVKDVVFFIESANARALSFLVKKYHDEVYVREHDLDTLFDEITESDLDYGGVLVQKTNTGRPEVLPLNSIAFCDQTDILGSPIAFKHNFAPEKLRQMAERGWGEESNGATISLEELIVLATNTKDPAGTNLKKTNQVPGKTIEVYVVRGSLPDAYLKDNDDMEYFSEQLHVVAFYTDKSLKKQGVTLYRKEDDGEGLKFHTSKAVHGRALGRGVGESLIHPQIWTNWLTIHKNAMLEAGSKVVLFTDDESFGGKNNLSDVDNLELLKLNEGRSIAQVPTAAVNNIGLYEKSINEWYEQAQLTGAAFDSVLGKQESAGTTFKGQERLVAQGRGIHDRRRGQRAKFIETLYREFIIPQIVKEITKGKDFLATLTSEEMTWISDQMATNYANGKIKEALLEGKILPKEEQDELVKTFKEVFSKSGNKKLITILKDEFKGVEIRMGVNIAGKQKDLVNLSDKLLSVFQYVFANPQGFQQAMQIPALSKSFADILEFSGLNQVDFGSLIAPPMADPALAQQQPSVAPQPLSMGAPQA